MPNSIFYNTTTRRFPVPLLAVETYSIQHEFVTSEEDFIAMCCYVLADVCKVKNPDADDIEYFLERIAEKDGEGEEPPGPSKEGKSKDSRSFGTEFHKYLGKITLDRTIMMMVGYDYEAARRIYCELDKADARLLYKDYLDGLREKGILYLDAVLYGMGGSYKGDKKSSSDVESVKHDLNTAEGMAALRSFGF